MTQHDTGLSEDVLKETKVIKDLLMALDICLQAIEEYQSYEYSGDPWEEDARAMGEMSLDEMKRDGRMEIIRSAVSRAKTYQESQYVI